MASVTTDMAHLKGHVDQTILDFSTRIAIAEDKASKAASTAGVGNKKQEEFFAPKDLLPDKLNNNIENLDDQF